MRVSARCVAAVALLLASGVDAVKTITLTGGGGGGSSATRPHLGGDRGPRCDSGASIASSLPELRATLIRTHDAGVMDWCVLFPNASRATDDPTAYDWSAGDALFSTIVGAGLAPYVRLGTSWTVPRPECLHPDPAVFARVAVQTVAHYNDGWSHGFTGKRIAALEIWNVSEANACGWSHAPL